MNSFYSISSLGALDAHNLWYVSSQHPERQVPTTFADLDVNTDSNRLPDHTHPPTSITNSRRTAQALLPTSSLGRLVDDERLLVRRCHAMADFGSTWLKPSAISKTLAQLREERREAEEHAEALRREQLQQELADAEAEAANRAAREEEMLEGETGEPDLDADVPDAEVMDDMGLSPIEDTDSEGDDTGSDEEGDEEEEEDDDATEEAIPRTDEVDENATELATNASAASSQSHILRTPPVSTPEARAREARHNILLARRMQEETVRRNMLRRGADPEIADDFYGDGSFVGGHGAGDMDEDQNDVTAGVLDEDDFGDEGGAGDMGRDLDAEVPEAEFSGVYEHTDSDESLGSSDEEDAMQVDEDDEEEEEEEDDDDDQFGGFARRHVGQTGSPSAQPRRLHRADASDFLASHEESPILTGSPQLNRRTRHR